MYNILICDDDGDIASALKIYLTGEGYGVYTASNGLEALEAVSGGDIHLVLMDIMMPQLDGLQATSMLREKYNIPIILLTAKGEDTDKILGLGVGADDYVTKPFNIAELLARVKSHLRRYTTLGGMERRPDHLTIGGIDLDDSAKSVTVDGEPVSLTPSEYAILKLLMEHPGRVFSSAAIYSAVTGGPATNAEASVAVHIRHLREKIEIDPSDPRYIKVVWGHGYRIEEEKK